LRDALEDGGRLLRALEFGDELARVLVDELLDRVTRLVGALNDLRVLAGRADHADRLPRALAGDHAVVGAVVADDGVRLRVALPRQAILEQGDVFLGDVDRLFGRSGRHQL